jgi:hypothetical protein
VSFQVLADVKHANETAREAELERINQLGYLTPECPSHPLVGSWGIPHDTHRGTPGLRRRR